MNIPNVRFTYSRVYDKIWRELARHKDRDMDKCPSFREVEQHKDDVKAMWNAHEEDVMTHLSSITGLDWKENKINCFIVGVCRPMSNPLTLPSLHYGKVLKNQDFVDRLTHELIHQLFIQNKGRMQSYWTHLRNEYSGEASLTRVHIPLYAIHTDLLLELFTKDRLDKEIEDAQNAPKYRRAWEIVQEEGHERILGELQELTC